MAVDFAFVREDFLAYPGDVARLSGGERDSDPVFASAPADVSTVLWTLSSPAERQLLLDQSVSSQAATFQGVDTSIIIDPYYRAMSEAGGGYWKHDPAGDQWVGNDWMTVGIDVDGGVIYRRLTDYDVYGPNANHAYPPASEAELLQRIAPQSAFVNAEDLARLAAAQAQQAYQPVFEPIYGPYRDLASATVELDDLLWLAARRAYAGPSFGEQPSLGQPNFFYPDGRINSGRVGGFDTALADLDRIARDNGVPPLGNVMPNAFMISPSIASMMPVDIGNGWRISHNVVTNYTTIENQGFELRYRASTNDLRVELPAGARLPDGRRLDVQESVHYRE